MTLLTALSLGAGVQSTTLLLLAAEGVLPAPDVAIFADTGWEPSAVYRHLDRLAVVAAAAGIEVIRVSQGNLRDDAIDPEHRYASIPYFILAPEGTTRDPIYDDSDPDNPVLTGYGPERPLTRAEREGIGRRQCTAEYKLAPITRKIRELLGAAPPEFRRVPTGRVCEQWIGFSTDEIHRVSDKQRVRYLTSRYPLLELGMSRKDCQRWLTARGWGQTPKSACIGCPFHGNRQWRQLRDTCRACGHSRADHWRGLPGALAATNLDVRLDSEHLSCAHLDNCGASDDEAAIVCRCPRFDDGEWIDAVAFDAAIRRGGARGDALRGTAYLHRSRVPLGEAPIDRVTRAEWADRQVDVLDLVADQVSEIGDPDGCSPYGCRSGQAVPSDAETTETTHQTKSRTERGVA
ncbi:hypothetical protein [Kribbella swartbergensis]